MVEKKQQRKTLKAMIRYTLLGSEWNANAEQLYLELNKKLADDSLKFVLPFQILLKDLPSYVAEQLAAASETVKTKRSGDICIIEPITLLRFLDYFPHRFFDRIVDQEQKQSLPKVVAVLGDLIKNGFQTDVEQHAKAESKINN